MTDKEEHRSGPYRINSTDEGSAVEDDYFDKETAYEAWQENTMTGTSGILRKYWILLAVLVLAIIGFVVIYNIMRPKTNAVRLSQTTVLESRIDALESRMTRFEEQMANQNTTNKSSVQSEMVDRLSDRVDRLESSFKTWMEEITAKMETASSQPVARKTSKTTTPKKPVASKKKKASVKEKRVPVKEKKVPVKEKKVTTGDSGVRYHTVQQAETLYRISLRYGLSVERIKEINQLSGNTIKPGQKLRVSP
jgi:LysM repeat protein